ncbi:hypothetical protein DLM_3626 [Aquitalea magnusonii]|uniref:Uncharacterized protein n=1 Tax=Aquitalea magnusonii TaxID=332411 RepID=A0A3G9GN27_9NEIS|nr:hypothetical protein DLM_3626 [Aquitalea magnusonii]
MPYAFNFLASHPVAAATGSMTRPCLPQAASTRPVWRVTPGMRAAARPAFKY